MIHGTNRSHGTYGAHLPHEKKDSVTSVQSEALILRHADYGEADRIVTFLTPQQGLLKGFAHSARKSRRRFGAALEPFARVRLIWTPPRTGDLVGLVDSELVDLRVGLREDLAALAMASYGCELAEELLGHSQEHQRAYALLNAFLDRLCRAGAEAQTRLLFELRAVVLAGYVPHLLHCSECGGGFGGLPVFFDPQAGGSLCSGCAGAGRAQAVDVLTLGSLSRLLRAPVEVFDGFRLGVATLAEASSMMREVIRLHLHRPLRSLGFLESLIGEPGDSGLPGE